MFTSLYGKNQITYAPQRSLASYAKDFLGLSSYRPYPVENKYGDFGFSNYPCGAFKATPYQSREYLNDNQLSSWTSEQLERISYLSPNATIIIYIPNGYNDEIVEKNDYIRETLIIKLQAILDQRKIIGRSQA